MKKIIVGNWKMNPASLKNAEKLFSSIAKIVSSIKKIDIVICPPFLYIPSFAKALAGKENLKKLSLGRSRTGEAKKIILGAQDVFGKDVGPFTGEVSAEMLYNTGARYVIVGHSERREMGENNEEINKKVKAVLGASLSPVLCVGENVRDESHSYFNLVKNQLEVCLSGISKSALSKIIIAYEPVWAISTTKDRRDATPPDSLEMSIFIRKVLVDKFGADAHKVRIIYGGSVNEKDALEFLKHGGVDGLLVGKASLDVKKFTEIVKICETLS